MSGGRTTHTRIPIGARRWTAFLFCCALLAAPAPARAQDTHLVVIVGVGGTDEHTTRFHDWGTAVVDAAVEQGLAESRIVYLADRPERAEPRRAVRSTRDNVTKAFADLAGRVGPDDEVFVVLIGHGSFDGRKAAFNLPGPDLAAEDYHGLLEKFPTQRIAFVNTASSSGAFVEVLAGPGRTIVAATRTGGERNETRFPEFFVEALTAESADSDRNGRVSVFEAFEFARLRVEAAYKETGHLLTEHATLDDGTEGKLAAMQYLAPARSRSTEMADASPALRLLVEERDVLERQINELRLQKDRMDPEKYEQKLERLATELALKDRAIRDLEAKK
jgi:hypothetical protein